MGLRALPLALLLALTPLAGAARPDGTPAGLVGLLSPNLVADGPPGCLRADTGSRLALHALPEPGSRRVGTLGFRPWREASGECDEVLPFVEAAGEAATTDVPHFESDYEVIALAVLERREPWLRLDLGRSSAWLLAPAGYRFEAYPELLVGKLAYATPAWRGELCAAAGTACRAIPAPGQQAMHVLSVADVEGKAWIEVELTTEPCGEAEGQVLHRGWLRARDARANPTVWFHSRGC